MLLIMTLFSSFRTTVGNRVDSLCLLVWEFTSEELLSTPSLPYLCLASSSAWGLLLNSEAELDIAWNKCEF